MPSAYHLTVSGSLEHVPQVGCPCHPHSGGGGGTPHPVLTRVCMCVCAIQALSHGSLTAHLCNLLGLLGALHFVAVVLVS
jgi:hypothetical protein